MRSSQTIRMSLAGRWAGPIVRDRSVLLRVDLSALCNTHEPVQLQPPALTPVRIERKQTIMNAYGKISYGGRRVNAYFGALYDADNLQGHTAGL